MVGFVSQLLKSIQSVCIIESDGQIAIHADLQERLHLHGRLVLVIENHLILDILASKYIINMGHLRK